MTRYAVLLRAVNVGGNNRVPMPALRELAADLGYSDVETYLQSGNLVLTTSQSASRVEKAVAKGIHDQLGLDIAVMARSGKELAAVVAANPFPEVTDHKLLHASFLSAQPQRRLVDALDTEEYAPERFAIGDRCLYLHYPNGSGRSKLATAPWDRKLGVRGTARNWRTVTTLLDLLGGPGKGR